MEIVNFQLLMTISVLTTLTTECIKTFLKKADKPYISNIIAAVVSVILSAFVCVIYPVIMTGEPFTDQMICRAVIMAFFGVLCATLSYKTVIETLNKLEG